MNTLSIHLPDNLEQQLSVYCEQNHRSKNDVMRFALENFFSTTTEKSATPYELGKDDFSSDETAYLMRSPKNAERLNQAIAEIEAEHFQQHDLIEP